MSCSIAWIAILLVLIVSVWSQEPTSVSENEDKIGSPRLVFNLFEPLRKSFCNSFCSQSNTLPYLMNLVCTAQCPELYPTGSAILQNISTQQLFSPTIQVLVPSNSSSQLPSSSSSSSQASPSPSSSPAPPSLSSTSPAPSSSSSSSPAP